MSSFHTAAFVVRCDHCGTQFGLCAPHPTEAQTRAVLHQRGWRFPTLTIDDHPRQVDLCPACLGSLGEPSRSDP